MSTEQRVLSSDRVRQLIERGLIPSAVQAAAIVGGRATAEPVEIRRYGGPGMPDTPLVQLARRARPERARGRTGRGRGKGRSPGRQAGP